jgi:hypothetical protein
MPAPAISGWERSMAAAERVKERMLRTAAALENAGVPYAVCGGNAVAEWVGRADPAAVRTTRDVDILLRRADLPAAKSALAAAGFVHGEAMGVDFFLDGPNASPRDAVHVVFANEIVREGDAAPTPDVDDSEAAERFQVVNLEPLLTMKLTAYRRKDQVHVLDLIEVGQIDRAWAARFPTELAQRLQQLLDDPRG